MNCNIASYCFMRWIIKIHLKITYPPDDSLVCILLYVSAFCTGIMDRLKTNDQLLKVILKMCKSSQGFMLHGAEYSLSCTIGFYILLESFTASLNYNDNPCPRMAF